MRHRTHGLVGVSIRAHMAQRAGNRRMGVAKSRAGGNPGRVVLLVVALALAGAAAFVSGDGARGRTDAAVLVDAPAGRTPHPLEIAHANALQMLADGRGPLTAAVEVAQDAIVRVRVSRQDGSRVTTIRGTGALLAGGRLVVTSSQIFDLMDSDARSDVEVAFADGRSSPASVLRRVSRGDRGDGDDWAVVELDQPRPEIRGLSAKDVPPETAREAVVLGFPDGLGWDGAGEIRTDPSHEKLALRPVLALVRSDPSLGWTLASAGGRFPAASGAPVIDADGYVVAIETGLTRGDDGVAKLETVPVARLLRWLAVHPAHRL